MRTYKRSNGRYDQVELSHYSDAMELYIREGYGDRASAFTYLTPPQARKLAAELIAVADRIDGGQA